MVKYILKVGKELFDVEHTAEESFQDFQAKVFAITDIPPKNLKVLCKSKMIKDNASLLAFPGETQLVVMGTKAGKELKKNTQVKEQKMEVEQSYQIPPRYGLVNCGNTCYMNAAIQLLRCIPQLNNEIKNYKINGMNEAQKKITMALSLTFKELEKKDLTPEMFVQFFLEANQTYLPLGTQHDSDQFMQQLMGIVSRASPELDKTIKSLFQIQFIETTKNVEIEEEPKIEISTSTKLCCNVGGVEKQLKIGTLNEGIKLSLQTELQKNSQVDNANHLYQKTTKFNSLPRYLLTQMVRFFWKKAEDLPHAKPTAAKICKSIDFSHKIDIFDYCTQELKEKLQKGRDALEEQKKNEEEQYKKQYEAYKESLGMSNRPEKRIIQEFKEIWKRKQKSVDKGLQTGYYDLIGTVTHLGKSVDSGHYMAWIKENEEDWTKYDDNTVYQQPSDKVLHLRGGQPNLEIAYILLFKKVYAKPLQ